MNHNHIPFSDIPKKALYEQKKASNPTKNIWVSANAGSGKTYVLTQRVLRLLLNGTEPARILCLTYTKSSAAVMQNRIFNKLAHWTRINDEDLVEELYHLEGKKANAEHINTARKLFAYALEKPGGMKIQTIHAFCEALLHKFPIEANISSHFNIIDDIQEKQLISQAKKSLFSAIYQKNNHKLVQAFHLLLYTVGESGLQDLFEEALANRNILQCFINTTNKETEKTLHEIFALKETENTDFLTQKLQQTALFPSNQLIILTKHGGKNTANFVKKLQEILYETDSQMIRKLCFNAYFHKNGKFRNPQKIFTKSLQKISDQSKNLFLQKQIKTFHLLDKLKAAELISLNKAAYILINYLLNLYNQLKKSRNLLDFDDLIYYTISLLKNNSAAQWILYKIDYEIDHILIDEAQDISPAQWEIIQLLSNEFFSGKSNRKTERTVFAVGDEKQSIYSFQGAIPDQFSKNGDYIKHKAENANKSFQKIKLEFSFRSANDILSAVDHIFSKPANYQGLSTENQPTRHKAVRRQFGSFDIWESFFSEKKPRIDDWCQPKHLCPSPSLQLAEKIAETIKNFFQEENKEIHSKDIMILVRKRDHFIHTLSRALKKRGISIAGLDRLHLMDHIAIRDLIALGRFVIQSQDDLSLAAVLKSPLFNLDEEQLFTLSANRKSKLWSALENMADKSPQFRAIVQELRLYQAISENIPVFEFYSHVLSQNGGRRKIIARLGTETNDVLDTFLDYSLSIEKTGLPGLQAFLETLESVNPEIKREINQTQDQIRIMTVHAAKGLEASIVFLVDSGTSIWNHQYEPKLVPISEQKNTTLIWLPTSDLKTQKIQTIMNKIQKQAEEEYRRLLYVGMTRSKDRLILCGYSNKQKISNNTNSWLSLASHALIDRSKTNSQTQTLQHINTTQITQKKQNTNLVYPPLPEFLKENTRKKPSKIILKKNNYLPLFNYLEETNPNPIHSLLQFLSDIPIKERDRLTRTYLKYHFPNQKFEKYLKTLHKIVSLLKERHILHLVSTKSKADITLTGMLNIKGTKIRISGQIDRLTFFKKEILLATFKNGKVPPNTEKIPISHLVQITLYKKLIEKLYPHKKIRSILIYTQKPILFEIKLENKQLKKFISQIGNRIKK
ncbi:MAG: ATP-dependent helicase/nuclease subunit A [Candidatus Tokpelaia sp. JSC161]|nr:MAG: ATP-dependent helicase/nuclease subunit A [Candidatus Tokpelaia sp. JSC161]